MEEFRILDVQNIFIVFFLNKSDAKLYIYV